MSPSHVSFNTYSGQESGLTLTGPTSERSTEVVIGAIEKGIIENYNKNIQNRTLEIIKQNERPLLSVFIEVY